MVCKRFFFTVTCTGLAWEISLHFATLPLVSPRNEVWETTTEIPYWWRVTTQIWVVLLIGRAAKEICLNQSEALSRSGLWHVMSKEFLQALVRRHFAVKLVVGSRSAGCFLRHVSWTIVHEIERETDCAFTSFSWSTLSQTIPLDLSAREKLLTYGKKAVDVGTCRRYQMRKNYGAFSVTKPVILYVSKNTRKCLFTST